MKVEFFDEPQLEFGSGGTHVDIRHGLMQHGPLDLGEATAPNQIRVGLVGTSESIDGIRNWLQQCEAGVGAKKSRLSNLFPLFPGFRPDTTFRSQLAFHDRWTSTLRQKEIDQLLKNPASPTLVQDCVRLFVENVAAVKETAGPMVVICAPPKDLLDAVDARVAKKLDSQEQELDESSEKVEEDNAAIPAFHDLLKAEIMRVGVPIQMVRPSTYGGQGRRSKNSRTASMPLQDEATRAWNIHTALYYKAGGAPWRLLRSPSELTTCFVGISFYRSLDGDSVMTSVAQVFNERGEGIIVKGAQAELDKNDRQPHLSKDDAKALLKNAIAVYRKEHHTSPARLVVHKTSRLTLGEVAGLEEATDDHDIDSVELISVKRSFTRLYREGTYPPLRGTFLRMQPNTGLLYLRGSVQFFQTYPGMYVPLVQSNKEIWDEITALLAIGKVDAAAAALRHHLEYAMSVLADQLGARPQYRADGTYELEEMLTSVLKRTKELWGKAAESAKSWGKSDKEADAADRKKFLSTCDAVMRVEQWSVNKAVHYNAWANFGVNDFKPVVAAFKELMECFRCKICNGWIYILPKVNPQSLRCTCETVSFNLTLKPK